MYRTLHSQDSVMISITTADNWLARGLIPVCKSLPIEEEKVLVKEAMTAAVVSSL